VCTESTRAHAATLADVDASAAHGALVVGGLLAEVAGQGQGQVEVGGDHAAAHAALVLA
jgi:hypothetical protein